MGLQIQLTDLSPDNIPLLLLCLVATSLGTLRSFIVSLVSRPPARLEGAVADPLFVGSQLSKLSEQLRDCNDFPYQCSAGVENEDCVVCRCQIDSGDIVSELPCHHVFHQDCLRGWLRHLRFSCPLCRFQLLVPDSHVDLLGPLSSP